MKQLTALLLSFICFTAAAQSDPYLGIVPAPVSVNKGKGEFKLTPETIIFADTPSSKAARYLLAYLKKNDYGNEITDLAHVDKKRLTTKNTITLSMTYKGELPPEGYELDINDERIIVKGRGAGLFYGVQTLIQLLNKKDRGYATLPAAVIKDNPRFGYRGMHLDVVRHFFDVAFVKKYIDAMAMYKLNTFHWHLTDDQGWRIEVKKYPKLTEIGSKRAQSKIGKAKPEDSMYDGTPHGGFYTQDEVSEIVQYAYERCITVIPEIEMPGHATAAIAAYPELSCDPNKAYKVVETWGVFNDIFCPTNETFKMLYDIIQEVHPLFPGKYIHIGGDEVPKIAWNSSDFARQLIADQNLRDANGLQSYFISKIEKFVNSQGRSIIGWDEILEGGLAPNATVMSWRGEKGGIAAAQLNHDVIMTPSSGGLYLDHRQSKSPEEPLSIGGFAPLSKTYAYDPVPEVLTKEQAKHIIGVQANLWTEYIATPAKAEYMLLPRMLALAEVAWSPKGNKDFKNFSEDRLAHQLPRLDAAGYNYRVPEPIGAMDTTVTGDKFSIQLKAPVEGASIHYTLDGNTPGTTDLLYTAPLALTVPAGKEVTFKCITITPSGKKSNVVTTKLKN
ncbi:MAG: family 20 glycosylhydrolase [Bacteroidota bacterium]